MENPIYKWMMTGGTSILGNLHVEKTHAEASGKWFANGVFSHIYVGLKEGNTED